MGRWREYPRYGDASTRHVLKRIAMLEWRCLNCGHVAKPGESIVGIDIQYDRLREHNDVIELCLACSRNLPPVRTMINRMAMIGDDTGNVEGSE